MERYMVAVKFDSTYLDVMMFRALYTDLSRNGIKLSSKFFWVLRLVLVFWDQGGECWADLNFRSWLETKSWILPTFMP
jgi:hypothetical protein